MVLPFYLLQLGNHQLPDYLALEVGVIHSPFSKDFFLYRDSPILPQIKRFQFKIKNE
jgi:hypothetical protein